MTVVSKKTGASYPISLYIPASYDAHPETPYPAIYINDGDAKFTGGTTRFEKFMAILKRRNTSALLISIGNFERRQTDYNFPGATAYSEFITTELIPIIDSQYRTDVKKRVLSGLSTGGSFVVTTLFTEAPDSLFFSHFISTEAAIWQQEVLVSELQLAMKQRLGGKALPVTLILARASAGGNSDQVNALYRSLKSMEIQGLQLFETAFPFGHAETDEPAFDDAIARIFG